MGVLVTAHLPLVRNQESAIFWSLKLTQINTTPKQVSILGNVISILAISFGERMQNKANCFIFSLALSDLCSSLVSPIGIYIKTWGFNPFVWPHALCNIYWAI